MILKTNGNIRNTKYGPGLTSAEVSLMMIANLSGLSMEDLSVMTEDASVKDINPSTFDLNGRKMNNLLSALNNQVITISEFKEELRGELDRSRAKFDSIEIE
tara:strand:- start:6561 stop:6866 length:306 start_codon:yes stop_codon:yes gene_type:complete